MQSYSVKPTEVGKLAFGLETRDLAGQRVERTGPLPLCRRTEFLRLEHLEHCRQLGNVKTVSLTRHISGMRERETMHITESKVSEKPTEMIVSNRADATFSCGLSFNGAGETGDSWLAFFNFYLYFILFYFLALLMDRQPNVPGSAP